MTDNTEEGPGPFTLEAAEEWLHWLEDVATGERDMGFATRFVLGNLLTRLTVLGIIDGPQFLIELRGQLHLIEAANERLGTQILIDDLLTQSPVRVTEGQDGPHQH